MIAQGPAPLRRRILLGVLILAAALMGIYRYFTGKEGAVITSGPAPVIQSGGSAGAALSASVGAVSVVPEAPTSKSPVTASVPPAPAAVRGAFVLPEFEEYARQARQNPHHVPRVVTEFAANLAPLMEKALASEPAARDLFLELVECARLNPERSIASVRAICAVNAARLTDRYPRALRENWAQARATLPDDTRRALEAGGAQ